jgi:hypothetical protein
MLSYVCFVLESMLTTLNEGVTEENRQMSEGFEIWPTVTTPIKACIILQI